MIEGLVINQEKKRLEYISKDMVCGDNYCGPIEKFEVYNILKGVVKNWNENNKETGLKI